VADFETVIMVAGGLGIATMLPYLSKLAKLHPRRVHLVWQIENIGKKIQYDRKASYREIDMANEMQSSLNHALSVDRGLIISVYIASGVDEKAYGKGGKVYVGSADLKEIIDNEQNEKGKSILVLGECKA
jgi:hypothetical protein